MLRQFLNVIVASAVLATAGCGIKGPLVLPPPATAPAAKPATTAEPAAPPAAANPATTDTAPAARKP